jgi:hypothetical protein
MVEELARGLLPDMPSRERFENLRRLAHTLDDQQARSDMFWFLQEAYIDPSRWERWCSFHCSCLCSCQKTRIAQTSSGCSDILFAGIALPFFRKVGGCFPVSPKWLGGLRSYQPPTLNLNTDYSL